MSLVKCQCTNCGSVLEVDDSKEAAICRFCNTPYIVEKAIHQYSISNTNYIQHAVFESEDSSEKLLKRGITQLELSGTKKLAEETFTKMVKLYPENYKGWLGLSIASGYYACVECESLDNAIKLCPQELKQDLIQAKEYAVLEQKTYGGQKGRIHFDTKNSDKSISKLTQRAKSLSEKIESLTERKNLWQRQIKEVEKRKERYSIQNKQKTVVSRILYVLGGLLISGGLVLCMKNKIGIVGVFVGAICVGTASIILFSYKDISKVAGEVLTVRFDNDDEGELRFAKEDLNDVNEVIEILKQLKNMTSPIPRLMEILKS